MRTCFITTEVPLQASPIALHQAIETVLQKQGEPLRWAITRLDSDQQIAYIEAVVLLTSPALELENNP